MQNYWNSLQDAIAVTSSRDLGSEEFARLPSPILNQEHCEALIDVMTQELGFGHLTPVDIGLQCAGVNWKMKSKFEQIIQNKVLLTLGSIKVAGDPIFEMETLDLLKLRTSGRYHVWWSLQSGEIVDITFATSMLIKQGGDLSKAVPLAGFPEQFPKVEWIPKLVGDKAIHQLLSFGW
ncbi:hypothetical protein [Duganella sp. BuS-21]|uniref:hypothetical protein n=1 Tax=Duganella sp. BuS-21 TaxID=2943848 RepID=UPI0035A6FBCE